MQALAFLRDRIPEPPQAFVVLGSGLSDLAEEARDSVSIPYGEIPGFPEPTVAGHAGRLVSGRIGGKPVLLQAGRFHFYEGHAPELVVAPVRLAAQLGARVAIFTNAAGSLDPTLSPESLLLLADHINLMWKNPLTGPVSVGEERFPDMSGPYDPGLRTLASNVAARLGLPLSEGTYVAVLGPSYETPAEVRFLAALGAQAVGMSTVPEVLTARALGMKVLALSVLTNLAAGLSPHPLDHQEVLDMGKAAGEKLQALMQGILTEMGS
jgi:purine-nucleoside phosphorylase